MKRIPLILLCPFLFGFTPVVTDDPQIQKRTINNNFSNIDGALKRTVMKDSNGDVDISLANLASSSLFLVTNATGATDVTGDGTAYTLTWPTEVYDAGSNFSSNTFTAPVTGKYYLTTTIELDNILVTHTSRIISIVTSNRNYTYIIDELIAQTSQSLHLCVMADMDANDTATISITVSGSTKTVDVTSSATRVNFSGALIN